MPKLDESLLTKLPPFSRLDRSQIREILERASAKRYDEGTAVFSEEMPAERFFLLLDGFIRVVRTTPTGEQVSALHIPPGSFSASLRRLAATRTRRPRYAPRSR